MWSHFPLRAVLSCLVLLGARAAYPAHYLSPDVPTTIDGATFLPWQLVRVDGASYSSTGVLPFGLPLDALHRREDGRWLLSFEVPTTIAAITYKAADVALWDGTTFLLHFDASTHGLPPDANIDAIADEDAAGSLIVSFSETTSIAGGPTIGPSDLVRVGDWVVVFDADSASPTIPSGANVIAAARNSAGWVLGFDVPVTLGSLTVVPGGLVNWDGAAFSPFLSHPSWPLSSQVASISLLAAPGEIDASVRLSKGPLGADLEFSWGTGCSVGAEDAAIYAGTLGSWYSHVAVDCHDDGGDRSESVPMPSGSTYYLVVPQNPDVEGLYGASSGGIQRPRGGGACRVGQAITPCP